MTTLSLAALLLLGAPPAAPPTYELSRASSPVTIDGALDEPAWAKAVAVDLVNNADGAAAPASLRTRAKLLYDDTYLYVGFTCADDNVWATMAKRDEHLWEEEVVEIFLKAGADAPSYVELEVNPLGAMLDIYLLDVRKPLRYESWNSEKLKWAVRVDGSVDGRGGDRGWSCEIAFPLEDAVTAPHTPPRPGDRWRMNLYRGDAKPAPAALAWSPTLAPDFHRPASFGELVFTDRVLP